MAKTPKPSVDLAAVQSSFKAQFTGLTMNDPPSWPALPRYLLCVAVTALVVVALWFAWLNASEEELTAEKARETQLKQDYSKKLAQAVNLEALKKQREQVMQYVTQLSLIHI